MTPKPQGSTQKPGTPDRRACLRCGSYFVILVEDSRPDRWHSGDDPLCYECTMKIWNNKKEAVNA